MLNVTTEQALEELASRCPDDQRMLLNLARIALDTGHPVLCQRLLIRATTIGDPQQRTELATSFAQLASHFQGAGDHAAARLSLERSLRLNPADHMAREKLRELFAAERKVS